MTESARLVTEFALNELKANRVMIRCDSRNTRSAAVARRLGYVFEGALRNDATDPAGEIRTTFVFSRIPGDPPIGG
jgi:RimJ/RimL family protein N-acetyltransferase